MGTQRSTEVYAHNNYIELLVDVGIVGIVIYYYIYLYIIFIFIKNRKNDSVFQIIMFGILISFIVNEYGMVTYYGKFQQLMLALTWVSMNNIKYNLKARCENEK